VFVYVFFKGLQNDEVNEEELSDEDDENSPPPEKVTKII
jgi:hypothetical protein